MKPCVSRPLACLALAIVYTTSPVGAQQARQGAAATGQYRDLFKEAGHSDAEIRQKIDAAWQQLFHGDSATGTSPRAAGDRDGRGLLPTAAFVPPATPPATTAHLPSPPGRWSSFTFSPPRVNYRA